MARTRTLKVTLTYADDVEASKIDAAVESIIEELNSTVQDEYTRAGADKWIPSEGRPSVTFAFADSATVEAAVTLSERVERATLIHFGTQLPA